VNWDWPILGWHPRTADDAPLAPDLRAYLDLDDAVLEVT